MHAAAESPSPRSSWLPLVALLLLSLVVRGGVLWARFGDLRDDPDGYREIADAVQGAKLYGRRLVISRNPPHRWPLAETAYRPPLYPYALVAVAGDRALTLLRIALFHLALGVASVMLTYGLAKMWGLAHGWALLAAVLVACDPILLRQSTLVMTETLATFIALLALVALTRFSRRPEPFEAALVGVALGVAALCRPTFIPFAALVLCCLPILRAPIWRRVFNVAACGFVAALVVAPWAFRNYIDLGAPIISTTHGGYTLALGNNTGFYQHLRQGKWHTPWDAENNEAFRTQRRNAYANVSGNDHWEIKRDRACYQVAFESMRSDPWMFVASCVYRLWRFWSPLAMQVSSDESKFVRAVRYAAAVWYVALFAAALAGVWRLRGELRAPPWLWGMLLCVSFTLVHALYWSDMRMRAPLMPVVALLAAVGCQAIIAAYLHRRRNSADAR